MIDTRKDLGKKKISIIERIRRKWRIINMSDNEFTLKVNVSEEKYSNDSVELTKVKYSIPHVIIPTIGFDVISKLTNYDCEEVKVKDGLTIIGIINDKGYEVKLHEPIVIINGDFSIDINDSFNIMIGGAEYSLLIDDTLYGMLSDNKLTMTSICNKIKAIRLSEIQVRKESLSGSISSNLYSMDDIERQELKRSIESVIAAIDDKHKLTYILTNLSEDGALREFKGKDIADEIGQMLQNKNSDYGSAVYKDYKKFGTTAILIWLSHKMNRLESLNKKGYADVANESFVDTLKDIAGYAICGLDALGYHHDKDVK